MIEHYSKSNMGQLYMEGAVPVLDVLEYYVYCCATGTVRVVQVPVPYRVPGYR